MAVAANFTIGANDEHGLNPPTAGKRSPTMPYLNRSFYENEFNRAAKQYFIQACLRVGFNVFDVKPEIQDISITNRIIRINRQNLACIVTFAYNAYGSGTTFNSANGFEVFYSPQNINPAASRQLSNYIYSRIDINTDRNGRGVNQLNVSILNRVNCPSSLVEAGFMTNFIEAKLMSDPDYALIIGESACQGVCDFLQVPFVARNNMNAYPTLRLGGRGNKVKLLQYLLIQNHFNLQPDGVWGAATENAVRTFQRNNNLAVDGIAGPNTWRALLNFNATNTVLRPGSRQSAVTYMQQKLLSKLYPVTVDGVFGPQTEAAVRAFQRENNLTVDGIAGPNTWQKLSVLNQGRPLP